MPGSCFFKIQTPLKQLISLLAAIAEQSYDWSSGGFNHAKNLNCYRSLTMTFCEVNFEWLSGHAVT